MKHPFIFAPEKAIETILYIVNKLQAANFHRISKMMYFADKAHLEEYGCFICGDSYIAMKHGPVPNCTYDILKAVQGDGFALANNIIEEAKRAFTVLQDNSIVKPLRKVDLDELSESEMECLDRAISQYGTLSFQALSELSHDAPWQAADENDCIDIERIVALFPNAELLLEHLKEPYPG